MEGSALTTPLDDTCAESAANQAVAGPEPPASIAQLLCACPVGSTVFVTDTAGAVVQGKVTAVTNASLTIEHDDVRTVALTERTFARPEIREIQRSVKDSRSNGAMYGLLIGAIVPPLFCQRGSDDSGLCRGIVGFYGGLSGLAIGFAVDAAITRRLTVYRAGGDPTMSMGLLIAPGRVGVGLQVKVRRF